MSITDKQIDELLSNDFVVDCIEINLTQKKSDNPKVYSGSGSIFQRSDGYFYLKLYYVFNENEERYHTSGNYKPGELFNDDVFFVMDAVSMSGASWSSDNIYISKVYSSSAVGRVIEVRLDDLKKEEERYEKSDKKYSHLFLIIKGKYSIPCNKVEELPHSSTLNTCEISINDIDLVIKKYDAYISVSVKGLDELIDNSFKERLVESLCIISGKLNPVLFSCLNKGDVTLLEYSGVPSSLMNRALVSPIKNFLPVEIGGFKEFIGKYLTRFDVEKDVFFRCWYKINRSWQAGIEHVALTTTTSIEGVVKKYYKSYGQPGADLLASAREASEIIKQLEIDPTIKSRLTSNLDYIKSTNSKKALYDFVKKNQLDKNLVDRWVSLRNKSAHADDFDADKLQKHIDDVYVCLNLFYVLLLFEIGYEGKYRDFSKVGWTDSQIPRLS